MKSPFTLRGSLLVATLFSLAVCPVHAQDTTPPVVVTPIKDVTVGSNSAPTILSLDNVFGLDTVKGTMVRMTTNVGKIDVELYNAVAPNTVANFLQYVTAGSYTDAIFHKVKRNATGTNVIVLGGEFNILGDTVSFITTFGNVANEYSLPNTPGTIAMFKQPNSPDSASDQWFFNVTDNSAKYGSGNNGGYTVFGRVIGKGMDRVNNIAGLATYDIASAVGIGAFKKTPLYNYDPAQIVAANNLVVATSVAELPLLSQGQGTAGALKITVAENSNPNLVTANVAADKLLLSYAAGETGTASITLQAKDQAKTTTTTTFSVTVR